MCCGVVIMTLVNLFSFRSNLYISNESLTSVAEGHNSLIHQSSCQGRSPFEDDVHECSPSDSVSESTYHYPKQVAGDPK